MEASDTVRSPLGVGRFTLDASVNPLSYFLTTILVIVLVYSLQGSKFNTPSINPKGKFDLTSSRPRKRYITSSREMVYSWFRANPNKAVRIFTDMGECVVLPPSLANEIRNDDRLSFNDYSFEFFQCTIPGFEPFFEGSRDHITLSVLTKDLTKALAKVTEPLADETALALKDIFTVSKDWHAFNLRTTILHIVARISSRIFLGPELCRNEEWLSITTEYATVGFASAERLREWPPAMRPFVHWFLPGCQKLRTQVVKATKLIKPVIEKRRALRAAAIAEGRPPPTFNDAIDWFDDAAKGDPYDPTVTQLFLATVAIHTTTDLVLTVLVYLALNPEMIQPLREDILGVLRDGGWQKNSLYNMKLLDSVIKESQRLKPLQLASMNRYAREDVTLSDGTFIPKRVAVCVSSHYLFDPEVYENPEKWDGYRFLRMREQPGKENVSLLVSTSPEHMGFGHGKHACPGRFFAANEIKIALVHILLQYDWRIPAGAKPVICDHGLAAIWNLDLELEVRRRDEAVDLSVF